MRYFSLTRLIAIACFGLSIFLYIETLKFPPSLSPATPSSAVYPRIILIMLAILSLLVIVGIPRKREQEGFTSISLRKFFSMNSMTLKYCTLIVFYPYLVVWLGYFVTTPLILVLISWNLRLRNKMTITTLALGLTLFVYFIFYKVLRVPLPTGLLWQENDLWNY